KTTTLHAALGYINKPDKKIWTAEDPVEITQYGLRQVQVQPKIGFDFAAAMRAFLRADPDVIMVGEMRDFETAKTGVEASLTGHLVFSTLHTNSAPETIVRLLDMGIDPLNFADALLGILAQRLVRTLCKQCKESYHPAPEEYEEIAEAYGREEFAKLNIPYDDNFVLYRPKGCDACDKTGYKGRMGIHELLVGSDEIKRLVQKHSTVEVLREQAMQEGMTTLLQDGIIKSLQGLTDFTQVRRVCIK
ncbi:MAG: ATPase, T2SS/T4P/T4SS family, partial [Smithellaceae bacterium]